MASLLDRISLPPNVAPAIGPQRSKLSRSASASSAPYKRIQRPPKGDPDADWEHDMFEPNKPPTLSQRLAAKAPQKMNFGSAGEALRRALGLEDKAGLSIKGASSRGNVVQVGGLARGTTAADVEAIFKRCGPITIASLHTSLPDPIVRLTYKHEKDAQAAVAKFHGQPADGRTLEVKIVGGVNATLSGRIGAALVEGSVDVLMDGHPEAPTSKLRSNEVMKTDVRAHILGTGPDYPPRSARGGRGRGGKSRGRGRGRGRKGGAVRMDVD